jgi:iron complex outermembrane receptor protein
LRIPTSDGVARATGLEVELHYLSRVRWELDFALGLLDTEYLDIGDPPTNGTGLQPGIPFQFAPDKSYSLGMHYQWPLTNGGTLLASASYGWMGAYQRAAAADFQSKNPDGSSKLEPAYGILNARIVYEPPHTNWKLSLFGKNLTNQWYVNGGLDVGRYEGYDAATIGRPRELGIGIQFVFD